MNIRELLAAIRRYLYLLLAAVALGGGVAVLATFAQAKQYTSRATIFISVPQTTQRLHESYEGTLYSQERTRSYAELVTTPKVTDPVISELHLRTTPERLAKQISAEVAVDSVLLTVTAHGATGIGAARLVDAVTRSLITAVNTLESPGVGKTSPVRLQVVRPGAVPARPSSPRPALNLTLGLVLGAIAGAGAGILRNSLDTRVKSSEEVAELTSEPVLGTIPVDSLARVFPVADDFDAFSHRAEEYRRLRTNLRFVSVDDPPKSIAITSPIGGDGKSTTAMNLAFSLAADGARVVLVDADLRKPRIAESLGLVSEVGLTTVLSGQISAGEALQSASRSATIAVLASGPIPPNPSELLGTRQMRNVLEELAAHADFVIVDAAPLLPVSDGSVVAACTNGALMVVRVGATRREEMRTALASIDAVGARLLGVVVNKVPLPKRRRYNYYGTHGKPESPVKVPRQGGPGPLEGSPPADSATGQSGSTSAPAR